MTPCRSGSVRAWGTALQGTHRSSSAEACLLTISASFLGTDRGAPEPYEGASPWAKQRRSTRTRLLELVHWLPQGGALAVGIAGIRFASTEMAVSRCDHI